MQGDVIDNIYLIPAVYQKIFKPRIQIWYWYWYWLLGSDLCWAFWANRVIVRRTIAEWWCIKLCTFFFWATLYFTCWSMWHAYLATMLLRNKSCQLRMQYYLSLLFNLSASFSYTNSMSLILATHVCCSVVSSHICTKSTCQLSLYAFQRKVTR